MNAPHIDAPATAWTERLSRRAAARRGGLAVAATLLVSARLPDLVAAGPATGYASGGLGLTYAAWQARYGAGEPAQSGTKFPTADGAYYVGTFGATGGIARIERLWDAPGVTADDARAEAQTLIPADAQLLDTYQAPSARINYGTEVDRYQSPTLRQQFGYSAAPLTGIFVVIIEEEPRTDVFDTTVTHMAIVVGLKARG